jgi:hypothetical protein
LERIMGIFGLKNLKFRISGTGFNRGNLRGFP